MFVHVLASLRTDNWFYLVTEGNCGLLIDPIDPDVAVAAVQEAAIGDVRVVNTHWHPDHVGGNAEVAERLGCAVWAPKASAEYGVSAAVYFAPGEVLTVGSQRLDVLAAPGHTMAHVILACDEFWILGDGVLGGGIGQCRFGGDVATACKTIAEVMARCPDSASWYAGHDYSVANAAFGLSVLPEDAALQRLAARAAGRARSEGPLLPTMGQEREHNLFLRTSEPVVQAAVAAAAQRAGLAIDDLPPELSPAQLAFFQLRALRDRWK